MRIEALFGSGEGFFVGVAEVINEQSRGRDEILSIVDSKETAVHAIQVMDSGLIVDELHLLVSAQNAVNALKGGYMISRNLDIETAVYASGQKQISKALSQLGVTDDTTTIAVVVIGMNEDIVRSQLVSIIDRIGSEPEVPFAPDSTKLRRIARVFEIAHSELRVLAESDSLEDIQSAISRCVVGRVSCVALDA